MRELGIFNKIIPSYIVESCTRKETNIKEELERLKPHIEKFKDLAIITSFAEISWDKKVTKRLMEAFEIMKKTKYMTKCSPCEMYGLCAIKALVGNENINKQDKREAIYNNKLIEVTGYAFEEEIKTYYARKFNFNFDETKEVSIENPLFTTIEIDSKDKNFEFIYSKETKEFYNNGES